MALALAFFIHRIVGAEWASTCCFFEMQMSEVRSTKNMHSNQCDNKPHLICGDGHRNGTNFKSNSGKRRKIEFTLSVPVGRRGVGNITVDRFITFCCILLISGAFYLLILCCDKRLMILFYTPDRVRMIVPRICAIDFDGPPRSHHKSWDRESYWIAGTHFHSQSM